MCGVAGIAGEVSPADAAPRIAAMLDSMERRGPDGVRMHRCSGAVLGHRRLAIFDLSDAGAQPMTSPDGAVTVTFNGAIYNFPALRDELRSRGYEFKSATDTEVLLHGYREWGIDRLVSRLHGMFAFGLWDARERALFLVRDRLGVKPLLYCQRRGQIAFASTARALHAAGYGAEFDPQAITEFLEYGYVTDAHCIYAGVAKLAPASILRWHEGSVEISRYWDLPAVSAKKTPFAEAVAQTRELLLQAVQLRLQADVPVGALLSGGIDSSLVCWATAKCGAPITAYTVATPGDEWDETADAAATARELGLPHRVLAMDPNNSPTAADLARAFAEPFACASALGMIAIAKTVKSEATVLLTGDGGDDVFLGYPRHLHYAAASVAAKYAPNWSTGAWRNMRRFVPQRGVFRRAARFADYTVGGLGAIVAAGDGLPGYERYGMLGERLAGFAIGERAREWSVAGGRRVLQDYLAYERRTRFTGEYLTKVDGATMFQGLEARSPFLDQALWEFASSLPYRLRLHKGSLKSILRELARREIGERVASGAKRGFGIPVQRWIAGKWRHSVREAFAESVLEREGWLDSRAAIRLLDAVKPGETAPVQLWRAYVLETWMDEHRRSGTSISTRQDDTIAVRYA